MLHIFVNIHIGIEIELYRHNNIDFPIRIQASNKNFYLLSYTIDRIRRIHHMYYLRQQAQSLRTLFLYILCSSVEKHYEQGRMYDYLTVLYILRTKFYLVQFYALFSPILFARTVVICCISTLLFFFVVYAAVPQLLHNIHSQHDYRFIYITHTSCLGNDSIAQMTFVRVCIMFIFSILFKAVQANYLPHSSYINAFCSHVLRYTLCALLMSAYLGSFCIQLFGVDDTQT